jgi:hypothetical protein
MVLWYTAVLGGAGQLYEGVPYTLAPYILAQIREHYSLSVESSLTGAQGAKGELSWNPYFHLKLASHLPRAITWTSQPQRLLKAPPGDELA